MANPYRELGEVFQAQDGTHVVVTPVPPDTVFGFECEGCYWAPSKVYPRSRYKIIGTCGSRRRIVVTRSCTTGPYGERRSVKFVKVELDKNKER